MSTEYIEIAIAAYLLFVSWMFKTENLKSFILLKAVPFSSASFLIFDAMTRLGWVLNTGAAQ